MELIKQLSTVSGLCLRRFEISVTKKGFQIVFHGLLAQIKLFVVLPAYWTLTLDAGTLIESVPPLICAGLCVITAQVGGDRQYTQ